MPPWGACSFLEWVGVENMHCPLALQKGFLVHIVAVSNNVIFPVSFPFLCLRKGGPLIMEFGLDLPPSYYN